MNKPLIRIVDDDAELAESFALLANACATASPA